MMCAMMTICNPGDKVMVFSPFYENYGADAILSGAEPIYIPLVPPTYEFDIRLVEEGFRQGAKAIIVCNPSNPCGKVFSEEELMAIGSLAVKYDAFVVTDEVYEHMVYAPNKHVCMAALPGMYEHTITCNSLSKTYSITGWRQGYLIGPEEVIEAAKKVHDFLTVGAAAPLQEAAVAGLNFPESYYQQLLKIYTEKRDYFLAGLAGTVVFTVIFVIGRYRNNEIFREDVMGTLVPATIIFASVQFVMIFTVMALTGVYSKHREQKMLDALEKEMGDEMEDEAED